jgi:uncharacterized protein YciI
MRIRFCLAGLTLAVFTSAGMAQTLSVPPSLPQLPTVPDGLQPFAVEFRTGPAWQADKPPNEQAHFREHSANLKRLRDAGLLVLGARLDERGFIVIAAADEAAARAEIDLDPSVKAGVFRYQIAPLQVFYGGSLPAARRR